LEAGEECGGGLIKGVEIPRTNNEQLNYYFGALNIKKTCFYSNDLNDNRMQTASILKHTNMCAACCCLKKRF
jgi:hypothetical protein